MSNIYKKLRIKDINLHSIADIFTHLLNFWPLCFAGCASQLGETYVKAGFKHLLAVGLEQFHRSFDTKKQTDAFGKELYDGIYRPRSI